MDRDRSRSRNCFITVREFQKIFAEQYINDVCIKKKDIQQLRNYIDEQDSSEFNDQDNINHFLKPIRNGVQVNNYVGILQTNSGLTIEILPKIYRNTGEVKDSRMLRNSFLRMLRTVRSIDGKTFKTTNLDARRNNLLEIFISMFLSESNQVIKRGLKSTYVATQSNEKYLKGKLLLTQNLRKNCINNARFYTEFDEFLSDSPENQLIKTTLKFLLKKKL